jgi:hypothetical protein
MHALNQLNAMNCKEITKSITVKLIIIQHIFSAVNNLMDWPRRGTVMNYSGYMEPQDGAMSILLLFKQEAILCM